MSLAVPRRRVWGLCHSGFRLHSSMPSAVGGWLGPQQARNGSLHGLVPGPQSWRGGQWAASLNSSHSHLQSLRCREEGSPRHDALNSGKTIVSLIFFPLHNIPVSSLNWFGAVQSSVTRGCLLTVFWGVCQDGQESQLALL